MNECWILSLFLPLLINHIFFHLFYKVMIYMIGFWLLNQLFERLLLNEKTLGFLALGGEEFNLGPETRLDRSELLCNKVLLKYKWDRESSWHRHQKGAERVPPRQSSAGCYIVTNSLLMKDRNVLNLRMAPGPSPIRCILG